MRKIAAFLLAFFCSLAGLPAEAAMPVNNYQFFKSLQVNQEGLALIPLDQQVLGNTRDDLADLRISDLNHQEVPYQLSPLGGDGGQARPVTVINESQGPNELRFTMDLGRSGLLHNQLILRVESDKDYYGNLVLEGSDDQQQWSPVVSSKIFKAAPNYYNTTFSYPVSTWRFVRATIKASPLPRLTIASTNIYFTALEDRFSSSTNPAVVSQRAVENGKSELILDMGTKGYFIQSIALRADGGNYQRQVRVFTSNSLDNWQPLGSGGTISHYTWPAYEARDELIPVRRSAARYIKLEIEDGNSPPLNLMKPLVKGSPPYLLADLKPGTYKLWYGHREASLPRYDLARFAGLVDTRSLAVYSLGDQENNPGYAPPWTERSRWFFNAALGLAVLVLGYFFIKNLRQA